MSNTHNIQAPLEQENIDQWFSHFIDDLKTDQLLMSLDVASKEKKDFYTDMIAGDYEKLLSQLRNKSSVFYIGNIIKDYIESLSSYKTKPLKLALGLSDSKILVWAEINDGDDKTEDALLLAEATVNGKYQQNGFYLNSTIVEKSDNLDIPPHYQPIID